MNNILSLKPQVVEVKKFVSKSNTTDSRIVADYEIDFYLGGTRTLVVDEKTFNITEGSMVFRKPGQLTFGSGDYDMYALTLNFDADVNIKSEGYVRLGNKTIQKEFQHPLIENIPPHFHPKHFSDYIRIYKNLILNSYPLKENRKQQITLINELFFLINADICLKATQKEDQISLVIREACQYISSNFEKNISLTDLARTAHLSPNYFLKLFKNQTGLTPKEYILQVRLNNARFLLSDTNIKISAIASDCGFNDTSYFSMFFKKRFGLTPAEYRQSQK